MLKMWGHLIVQAATPAEDPVQIGSLWSDTSSTAVLKLCTSISPYTWAAITGAGGGALDDLTDVIITSAATGDYLRFNGTNWVDVAVSQVATDLAGSFAALTHASTHMSAGADPVRLDELKAPTDVTTLNASTSAHGLLKKLSNTSTEFMNGVGNWATPASAAAGSDTQVTFNDAGASAGDAGLTYNKTTDILSIGSGIAFPATQAPVTNVNTFDDYEEGTWTPNDQSGAALSFSNAVGAYTKIGKMVFVSGSVTYPSTADASAAAIGGLPFTSSASPGTWGGHPTFSNEATVTRMNVPSSNTKFSIGTPTGAVTNITLSLDILSFVVIYMAAD